MQYYRIMYYTVYFYACFISLYRYESDFYCDACNNRVYGTGLRLIRANGQEQVFGHKYIPLIFQVCSPECFRTLKACHEIMWNNECKIVN